MNKVATYRLQLQPTFGFDDARRIVPYLKALGISHVYASPYLQAASGSTHGYDVVDPTQVNQELGGVIAHQHLCEHIVDSGLQQLLDIVPNHMAIVGKENPWWWDVLENGAASLYANYFDVDWENTEERWQNKILLPVLANHYGRILEAQELQLEHQQTHFHLCYFGHRFPIDPSSLSQLLTPAAKQAGSDILGFLAESYDRIPKPDASQSLDIRQKRHRDKAVLHTLLRDACNADLTLIDAIDQEVDKINRDIERLDQLIECQNYRLAYWKTASHDLGYRRFFDVSNLAGLRVEDERVFEDTHALIFDWVKRGWIHGLRIDHSDGLRNPKKYFAQLRAQCPNSWIITEKILEHGEAFRTDWPIDGTTGYEFAALCAQLLTHPDGEHPLKKAFEKFTGNTADIHTMAHDAKEQAVSELLQSEFNRLTALFVNICERRRRQRDFSRSDLHHALCCVAKHFKVYRTYITPNDNTHPNDLNELTRAITCTKRDHAEIDPELLDFLFAILSMKHNDELEFELAMRFQQLTGPVMAKGMEDTTYYRYNVLIGHNEVGNSPAHFSATLTQFHDYQFQIHRTRPNTLLTLTTHDTKRSEDTRARLLALSEIPENWQTFVEAWQNNSENFVNAVIPNNALYFILQTLVGTWPISQDRLTQYLSKAFREAKEHTSWTAPNDAFENAVNDYIATIYQSREKIDLLEEFVQTLRTAGYFNSLSQTLIKLTAPGVPDIYQGTELWDFSLVDPDNRRPVDYTLRRQKLNEIDRMTISDMMSQLEDGLPKLWLTRKALEIRHCHDDCFNEQASYTPIYAEGTDANSVIAYQRGSRIICISARFHLTRKYQWQATHISLPEGTWHNALTGDYSFTAQVPIEQLLAKFPVAILIRNV